MLTGQKTIAEACAELDIGEAMFHRIPDRVLAAGLQALEPRPMGRPPKPTRPELQQLAELQQQNAALRHALEVSQVRAEIAQTMPQILDRHARAAQKKRTPPRK